MGVCGSRSKEEAPIQVTKTSFMITDDAGEPTKVVSGFSTTVCLHPPCLFALAPPALPFPGEGDHRMSTFPTITTTTILCTTQDGQEPRRLVFKASFNRKMASLPGKWTLPAPPNRCMHLHPPLLTPLHLCLPMTIPTHAHSDSQLGSCINRSGTTELHCRVSTIPAGHEPAVIKSLLAQAVARRPIQGRCICSW